MKRIILMALISVVSHEIQAQTNRTYKSDMNTERIYQEERRGTGTNSTGAVGLNTGTNNQETGSALHLNTIQQHQGYIQNDGLNERKSQDLRNKDREWDEISREDLPYRSVPYDTSKNNGHCIGCGSGTMTDPHPWQ